MAKKQTDNFDSFVEDFLSEKFERPLVIVGASKIDELLLLILSKYLKDPIEKEDELLKESAPIGTFSSRIKLTYRLGLIDIKLFKTLEQIRKIRNLCAHRIEFNVHVSPVREHLGEIKKDVHSRGTYNLTKQRYFNGQVDTNINELHCLLLTVCVILEAVRIKVSQTKGNTKAINISKK